MVNLEEMTVNGEYDAQGPYNEDYVLPYSTTGFGWIQVAMVSAMVALA
jgi:hypothetical protein